MLIYTTCIFSMIILFYSVVGFYVFALHADSIRNWSWKQYLVASLLGGPIVWVLSILDVLYGLFVIYVSPQINKAYEHISLLLKKFWKALE